MRLRALVSGIGALSATMMLAVVAVNAQTPSRSASSISASSYVPPKTPWGDPDLQAIWSGDSAFGIPLQRPENLGTKAELTDEEFAAKLKRDKETQTRAVNA